MEPYPHRYAVRAFGAPAGNVGLDAEGLPALSTASPPQFGGRKGHWSPETLFVGAVADCFILTFRAVAAASGFSWTSLECAADGVLERVAGVTKFTAIRLEARLVLPAGGDTERGRGLLEKAERGCLIANSLNVQPSLHVEVTAGPSRESSAAT